MNQLFYNIDIIISNFRFSQPIKNLQKCISMASFPHQRASITLGSLSMQRFWATDGNRKCAVFVFNFSSHYHINVVKSLFTSRYDQCENLRGTTVLACEMFTYGVRPWLKNVACLSSLIWCTLMTLANCLAKIAWLCLLCYNTNCLKQRTCRPEPGHSYVSNGSFSVDSNTATSFFTRTDAGVTSLL